MFFKSQNFKTFVTAVLVVSMAVVMLPTGIRAGGDVLRDSENFGSWTVIGPDGGDVRTVVIDPRDKDRLYIGTLDGQIHTSADGGKTWGLLVNLNKPRLILDQIIIDSRDSKVIYASGHRNKLTGGFFKTTDGGRTWKESRDLRNEAIHAMTQSESDPDFLFVGTLNGVWTSRDSGDSWHRENSDSMPVNVNSLAVDPRNTSTIYAGTWWRPYKSTDSGKSWKLIKDGMIDDSDVFAITINSRDRDYLVASACSGIYESHNGGERWAKIQGIPSTSRRTRDIVQHPSRPGTIYAATTEGFWMTTNGGKTWSMTTPKNLEINSIAVHPDKPDRVFIATNNHGVQVSYEGGRNFTPANASFTSRFTYAVLPDSERENRLYAATLNTATSGGFFFISDDRGQNWTPAKGIDLNRVSPFAVLQDRADANKMYLGTNTGIYQSADRGASWSLMAAPKPARKAPARTRRGKAPARRSSTPAKPVNPNLVPALSGNVRTLVHSEGGRNAILAGTDSGLYRSSEPAKGWEKLPFGEGIDDNVFVVHTSPLNPGTFWVGTAKSGVLVSEDDGKTWRQVGGTPPNIPISSIATDPGRPDYIYVGTIQSLYLSRDRGHTWIRRGGNLPLGNYASILINPNDPNEIIVASSLESDGGVYLSTDAGMKWKRIDSREMRLPSHRVWSMAFDPRDPDRIFAGSHSSGVYIIERRREIAESAVETAGESSKGNH